MSRKSRKNMRETSCSFSPIFLLFLRATFSAFEIHNKLRYKMAETKTRISHTKRLLYTRTTELEKQ